MVNNAKSSVLWPNELSAERRVSELRRADRRFGPGDRAEAAAAAIQARDGRHRAVRDERLLQLRQPERGGRRARGGALSRIAAERRVEDLPQPLR